MMIRGIVKSVVQGVIARFSATGRAFEEIDNRELFQHYGYTSRPKPGAEVIIIREGNQFVAIASDDRRYRISLEEGEAALYDDRGQQVHLTRTGIVVTAIGTLEASATVSASISAPTVTATAAESATVTAPLVTVTAADSIQLASPLVTVTGTLQVGTIQSSGALSLQAPDGISATSAGAISLTGATVSVSETGA